MLEKAILLAEKAHRGQMDKGGEPYILHPKRMMEHCETMEEKIVAILHDVIEDTEITENDLKDEGFSGEVVGAVVCLTKKDGEDYMDYIGRVCGNPLAAKVKLADLTDNMNLSRIPDPTEKDFARMEKYKRAKARIEESLRGVSPMETWTKEKYEAFREELLAQGEEKYKEFNAKLLCSELEVIGLRAPYLRKTAKSIAKQDGEGFLRFCGRDTHEERLLYGLVAAELPVSYEEFLEYCDFFTEELVENWALCDMFCSSVKKKLKGQEAEFFGYIKKYLDSENPWAVRVGLIMMLSHYLTPEYIKKVLERVDAIHSEHYYVRMGQAWLLATAWAKEREACLEYISHHNLDDWTFNKFIQKCCESYRVSAEDKAFLRSLKR